MTEHKKHIIKKVSDWFEEFPPLTADDNYMFYIRYASIRLKPKQNSVITIEVSQDMFTRINATYTAYYADLYSLERVTDSERVELELGI